MSLITVGNARVVGPELKVECNIASSVIIAYLH